MSRTTRIFALATAALVAALIVQELTSALSKRRLEKNIYEAEQRVENFDNESQQFLHEQNLKHLEYKRLREQERNQLRKEIESEEETEIQLRIAKTEVRLAYDAYSKRKKQAWNEYYNTPEECTGTLGSAMADRCIQHRRNIRKQFYQDFQDPQYDEEIEEIEFKYQVRVQRHTEGVPQLWILAPYQREISVPND